MIEANQNYYLNKLDRKPFGVLEDRRGHHWSFPGDFITSFKATAIILQAGLFQMARPQKISVQNATMARRRIRGNLLHSKVAVRKNRGRKR